MTKAPTITDNSKKQLDNTKNESLSEKRCVTVVKEL